MLPSHASYAPPPPPGAGSRAKCGCARAARTGRSRLPRRRCCRWCGRCGQPSAHHYTQQEARYNPAAGSALSGLCTCAAFKRNTPSQPRPRAWSGCMSATRGSWTSRLRSLKCTPCRYVGGWVCRRCAHVRVRCKSCWGLTRRFFHLQSWLLHTKECTCCCVGPARPG